MPLQISELKEHLDTRLDRIEEKLGDHLERISKAEEAITWIKGHLKISVSLLLAALSGVTGALYQYLSHK